MRATLALQLRPETTSLTYPFHQGGELSEGPTDLQRSTLRTRIQLDDADIIQPGAESELEAELESEQQPETGNRPNVLEDCIQTIQPEIGTQRRSTRISKAREAQAEAGLVIPRQVHRAFLAGVLSQQTPQTIQIPTTYEDAMSTPEAAYWHEAMCTEIQCLKEHNTWKLTKLPTGAKLVRGRWVYTVKLDVNGGIARYKARWVARGFTQQYGIDYEETYASVARMTTIRNTPTPVCRMKEGDQMASQWRKE